jgi:hypothetical protein
MKILHIHLTQQGKDYIALRYFWDNLFDYQEHRLPLVDVKALHQQAETDYYTRLPVEYDKTGQALYQWLDQSDHLLSNALRKPRPEGLILAIASDEGLAQLPWELLHDGKSFLIQKRPAVIPIRWVATGQAPIEIANTPKNRPLNVLFMATSPIGVEPILDYEAEEGQILTATQRTPVNLRVEESGCLSELGYLVGDYETGYFDVFHLTGHATDAGCQPYFFTESEYGDQVNSSVEDLVDVLGYPLPPVIFLSGCQTGYSSDRAIPSMAESLLRMGATAVLGWGERVRDTDATAAASALYQELATGRTLFQAIAATYQTLIQQQTQDWHKLRLYAGATLPDGLVTPPRTKGRKQLPKPSITVEFRDDEGRLRVASRENFVGRRRQLQNCLRTLKTDAEKVGVLICGMGGWGKSSIASRLWERLPEYEKVLWWRQLDEPYLIRKLKDKLIQPTHLELSSYLDNRQLPLKARLTYVFGQLAEMGETPFLLILDDFEWNLEPRAGRYSLKPEVAPLLAALVEASQESGTKTRILITCRYQFESDWLEQFFVQGLEPLKKAELTKKLNRLEQFRSGQIPDAVRERALALADGNPRLLEFLNDEVLGKADAEVQLAELERSPDRWQDRIIWEELYQLIDPPLQRVLSHCLVYELPVPMVALEAVCQTLPNYQQQLQRGREMGLLEVSAEAQSENRVYRVSRILPHILPEIQRPEAPDVYAVYQTAHDALHRLWGHQDNRNEEQWRELFRLKFANRDNPERFRQCFSQMLAVQYNSAADQAFETELREQKADLSNQHLYAQLETYLSRSDWQNADEETAWLFYAVMVKQGYEDWYELFCNFPSDILNEIDRLWVAYSDRHFGFSVQKRIWESVGGSQNAGLETWEKFGEQVGWYESSNWRTYQTLSFSRSGLKGHLPALLYTRDGIFFGIWGRGVAASIFISGGYISSLISRLHL